MATKIMACNVKHSCLNSSHTSSPSFHIFAMSSSNGSRNTSISFPGCFGPWISIDSIRYFRFIHSHEGMVRMDRTTGQVLCELLMSPNGFIPSVLNANLTFLGSSPNLGRIVSIFLHWLPSEGCQSISPIFFCACSKCQLISSESLRFENKRFKRAITGRYHMTIAGIFLFFLALEAVSSTSAQSSSSSRSSLRLYRLLLHTGHVS